MALPVAAIVAVDPSGLAPFGPIKWALVPSLVLAGTALRLSVNRGVAAAPERLHRTVAFALPAFVAWTAVAAVFGADGLYAWTGTPERHFGVATWALVLLCWWGGRSLDAGGRQAVLLSCAATAGVIGAWSGAEALGWRPINLVGIGDRPVGPLGSSAYLGAAAVLLTPIAIGVALLALRRRRATSEAQRWRVGAPVLAGLAAAGGLVALAVSGARSAWLGVFVAAVVAAAVSRTRRQVVLMALACAAVVAVVGVLSGGAARVSSVASDQQGGARGRLDEWRIATRVAAHHPVVGVGPEGYRIAFGEAVDAAYEREHGRNPLPDRAHSAPLDVAATTGIFGLALYFAAVGSALAGAVRTLRRGSPLMAGAAIGVVAYFVQSLFLFPVAELEPLVWLLAGLASVNTSPRIAGNRVHRTTAIAVGVVAMAVFVVGALDLVADRRAKRQLAAVRADEFVRAGAAALRPDQVRYHLADALVHESDGTNRGLQRALDDVDRALDVSPRDPVARREKGRLLLTQARRSGDATAARRYLAALRRDDPRNAETLLRFGIACDLAGDTDAAISAWRRAEFLAPESAAASTNLAVAYARAGRAAAARAAAERALDRDPDNETARRLLADLAKDGT